MTSPSSVALRGGLHVSAEALALAVALEMRGHAISAKDSQLFVTNGAALTAEDRAAIRRQRFHLMAIAEYRTDEVPA